MQQAAARLQDRGVEPLPGPEPGPEHGNVNRATNEHSRSFKVPGEGPYWGLIVVKRAYLELSVVYYYCVLFDRKNSQSQLLKALKEFCSGSKNFS